MKPNRFINEEMQRVNNYTLQLDYLPSVSDLGYLESILGIEIRKISFSKASVEVYTKDFELIRDLEYMLKIADIRILKIIPNYS